MEVQRNTMIVRMDARSENEGLARMIAASFLVQFNPTMEEMDDVKTAISEAVTNAVIHGYGEEEGVVEMHFLREEQKLTVTIIDEGKGMEDVHTAMQPMYTTKPELERSGMGFTFMEAFMDEVAVESELGKGTTVCMNKNFRRTGNQE